MNSWRIRWENSLGAFYKNRSTARMQLIMASLSPLEDDEGHQTQQHGSQYGRVDGNQVIAQPGKPLQARVSRGHALRGAAGRRPVCVRDIWWRRRRKSRKGKRRWNILRRRRGRGWAVRRIYICWRKGRETKRKSLQHLLVCVVWSMVSLNMAWQQLL